MKRCAALRIRTSSASSFRASSRPRTWPARRWSRTWPLPAMPIRSRTSRHSISRTRCSGTDPPVCATWQKPLLLFFLETLQARLQVLDRPLLFLDDLREHGGDVHRRESLAVSSCDELRHIFGDEADIHLGGICFVREG